VTELGITAVNAEQPSDQELVAGLAGGDMACLGELVRRHQDRVVGLAYRLLGRWDAAEDVGQDAFLHVHRAAGRYRPEALFTTWLYRIVVNLCRDVRRRDRRRPLPLPDRVPAAPDPPAGPLERRELAERVRRAVAQLPDRQRTAVVLHRYQGLSYREVAEATGWSASAVESLLVRAYAHLRRALEPLGEK
jgi:RNA polymerase sigma-70 factor (ECF subfamily)